MGNFISKNRFFSVVISCFLLSFNLLQAQTNVSGVISSNTTWSKASSPYVVTGNILVNSGVTLTINPGVEIRFDAGKYLKVEGEISAVGLADDSIVFTSNSSNKTKGSWDKIWLKGTASSYADNYDYTSGSIFKYCRFSFANEGIRLDDATIQIKNCLFFNNTYGINFKKTTNTLLYKNLFSTNTDGTSTSAGTEDNGVGSFTYCKIIENTFENNESSGFSFGGYRNNSNNHLIKNNIVKNNGGIGFNFDWGNVVTGFANNTIEQNIVYKNGSTGMIICRDQNIIRKNLISQNGGDGIGISGTYIYNGLTIERNIIVNNTNRGIDLSSNNNTLFRYNQIIKSGKKNQYAAIELPSGYIEAKNNTISYNTISYSNYYDFNVQLGPNIITYNNFFGFKDSGNYFMKVTHKSNSTITATNNYWASFSSSEIAKRIYDKTNDFELGEIIYTSPSTAPNTTAPVSIPINIKKSLSAGLVVLTWTANTESDIAGYKIYYGGFTGYSYTTSADVGNVLTYTLPAGVGIDEDIAVTAYDTSKDGVDDQFDGNESWYSPANKIPDAPTNLVADAGPRKIKLSWTASVLPGVNNYNIYRSVDNSTFTKVATTVSTNYTDASLTANTKYYYKITAFDSLDLSYDNYGLESQASAIVNAIPNRITYVSPTGDNTNIGSLASPKLTIANSVTNSLAGDTVLLNRGTYNEVVDLKGKISLLSSLYINTGDTNDITSTILSGSTIGNNTLIINTGTPAIASHHIYALTIQDVRLQVVNLNSGNDTYVFKLSKSIIKNSGSYGQWGVIALGNYGVLDSCRIFGNKARYVIGNDRNSGTRASIISNNTFYGNSSSVDGNTYDDVSVIHVEQPKSRVFNNLIFRNLTTAIDFGLNGSDSMIFINNTIALNKGYGVKFTSNGSPYGGYLINNVIKFNTQKDIFTNVANNGPDVYIKNNFFSSSGSLFGTNLQDVSKVTILDTTGNIGGDPYFVDTLNNNYRLKAQSSAIGAGTTHSYPNSKDIIGNDRINPWRLIPDMGAFESNYKFSAPLLTKTEPGNKKVVLFWTKNTNSNIVKYKIYRSTSPIPDDNSSSFLTDISDVNILNYKDSSGDLINGTKYYYRLKSVHNDNSLSGFGNELTGTPEVVAVPNSFTINNSPLAARLSWNSIGLTGAKYQLFKSTNINSKTLLIDSLSAITYDDVNLSRNTKYYYWIRSMNSDGTFSEYSDPLTLIPTNVWYVDSAIGNDNTGIGSILAPYKKITKAVSNTINLDSVYINDGTYIENITYSNKQLSFIGVNGARKVILKPLLASQIMAVTQNGGKSLFKGLTFTGGGNSAGSAIYTQTSNPIIENCIFRDNGTNMSGSMLQLNRNNFTITNCLVYNNSSNVFLDLANGLDSIPYITNLTYANNNNRWFYATGITTFAPSFKNSIIWNSSDIAYQGGMTVENSIIKGGFPGTTTNIDSSPQFVDSANNDFHLKNYSPAIGLGTTISSITKDFEGNNRALPSGSMPDAGAFESVYDHSSPLITTDSSLNSYVMFKMSQIPNGTVNKFSIYKGLTSNPNTKYVDTTLVTKFTDSANVIFNKVIYYRLTSTGSPNLESGYSNEIRTIAFTPPLLGQPLLTNKVDTNATFTWGKIDNATNYKLQYSTDSTFTTNVTELSRVDSFYNKQGLVDNTTYFWRVQTLDSVHTSKWSDFKKFQTFVRKPILNSISTVNRVVNISWSVNSLRNIKSFKIYRGTSSNPTTKIDSINSVNLTYNDSVTNGIKYYYRVTAVNTDNIESGFSNELFANTFGISILDSPFNNKVKEVLKPNFKWQTVEFATKNNIQISTDSLFASTPILDTVTAINNLYYSKGLSDNTTYYWRIRVGDDKGYGNWTSKNTFQTYVLAPTLLSVSPSNKIDTLKWSVLSSNNIKYFKIYRDTVNNPLKLIDSIDGALRSYIDTTKLNLNQKYYYRIVTGNMQNNESDYGNTLYATPFNTKPRANTLSDKNYNNVGEYNYVRTTYSSTGSVDVDGKIVDFKWYVNDSLVNSTDSILIYYYNQGSNKVKLVITDNDGGKDSTTANVSLSSFVKSFRGGFLGGITALSQNLIYTADSTFDPISGASISMLDRAGNTIYPLVVSSKIFTTPSVSSDSSVFITSGSSLNGFNKFGAPLWSTIPLGGLSYVTPTIDSLLSRIYVGVSNKNFFAIDYKTGKVAWSIFGDAPINSSAVITGDRKLVFTSQNGTLYGFDIRTNAAQSAPKWTSNFGDIITKSPAVDANNNLIIGTQTGKVLKVKLNSDGTITRIWTIDLSSEIQASPVIDGDGFLYVGNKLGDFYKLNPDNGSTIWKYSTGAAIKSTPTISEFGTLYVSNANGLVTALKTDKSIKWTYQADGAISANMLYISNMLYVGSESGKFFAIYDNPNSNTVNTGLSININKNNFTSYSTGSLANVLNSSIKPEYQYYFESFKNGVFNFMFGDQVIKPKKPIWGTFQGNNQRTGSATFECPDVPVIRIPDCTDLADSIKITTNDLIDKIWVVNDKNLSSITDTSISVKSTDVVKLMAYNSNGCNVFSSTPLLIANSSIAKPKIVTSTGSSKFCEGDSIVLSSNINTAKYQWNYSSSPVTGATLKNLATTLQGAYSVTAINEFGCKATSDLALILTTPKPTVASIDGVNSLCIGVNSSFKNSTIGGIWSSSSDAIAKVDASGNVTTIAAGSTYINYTITSNGCSAVSKLSIKVNATPDAPKADNVSLCVGGTSSSLTASATGGHSLLWYGTNATGGTSSGTAPIPTANSIGNTDYYVSQLNNTTTCESPRTKITVSVAAAPNAPLITRDANGNLVSSASTGNQWYKNGTEIIGAISAIYKPTEPANYSVKIQGNCISPMSTVYYFLVTDVINLSASEFIKLAPNPFVNNLNLDFAIKSYQKMNLDIFSISSGSKVFSRTGLTAGSQLSLGQLSAGVYLFHFTSADGKLSYQFKMMKL